MLSKLLPTVALALASCIVTVGGFPTPAVRAISRTPVVTMHEPSSTAKQVEANPNAWLNLWFPVMFSSDVPSDGLVSATIFERPLVLFRDRNSSAVQCLADQCPHRLAPLSDGRLAVDEETGTTRVECSYHGWQFSGCGRCTKLPQVESGKPILPLYDASAYPVAESQDIIYVFIGDQTRAESVEVPRVPELDQDDWVYEQDYLRDLPYDYTTVRQPVPLPRCCTHLPHVGCALDVITTDVYHYVRSWSKTSSTRPTCPSRTTAPFRAIARLRSRS